MARTEMARCFSLKMTNTYYKHIDGLRAIAVVSVLLYHLDIPFITGGFVGVDIFFVISGYLITGIILKEIKETGSFSFIGFYFRRAKRILPALVFTLLICLIFSVWLLNLARFKLFGGTLVSAAASVSNIFFLHRQARYFDIYSQLSPLLHTWSLGVEEQFYIVWPLILLVTFKCIKKWWGVPLAITLIGAISFYLNLHRQSHDPMGLYYLVQYRAFEFCIGAFALWLLIKGGKAHPLVLEFLCLLGLVLTAYPFFKYTQDTIFPSYNALVPAIGVVLLIYAGSAKYCGQILRNRIAVFIGLISYSLYLVHWPLIVFVKSYNENMGLPYALQGSQQVVIGIMALLLAFLMYRFIEQPVRSIHIYVKRAQGIFVLKWVVVLSCIAIFGMGIRHSNGWLWRINSSLKTEQILDVDEYHTKHWGGAGFTGGLIHAGKQKAPLIVMMGDSHSGMLDTGIVEQIAKPLNLTIFTVSGGSAGKYESSLLLPGTTRLDKNQSSFDVSSQDANVEVMQQLTKSADSILIYSAAYSGQLLLAGDLNTHSSLLHISPGKSNNPNDYKLFLDALERMRVAIGDRKFLIIGDFPESPNYSALNCIARLRWFRNTPLCAPEQSRFDNMAAINVNRVLRKYADAHDNVYFIDPYDVFCDKKLCRNLDADGAPLYSDTSHLSQAGSNLFFKKAHDRIVNIIHGDHMVADQDVVSPH